MDIATLLPYFMSGGMAVISSLCAMAVKILSRLAHDVHELNRKMAVIMNDMTHTNTRTEKIEERLEHFDTRLRSLEQLRSH